MSDPFMMLGRHIGTFTGWDHGDTFEIQVYDFKPIEGVDLPEEECLSFSLETGKAWWYDDPPPGTPEIEINWQALYHEVDFAPLIVHVPLVPKVEPVEDDE